MRLWWPPNRTSAQRFSGTTLEKRPLAFSDHPTPWRAALALFGESRGGGPTTTSLQWDDSKNAANIRKHGVSFEEAQGVFADEHGLLIDDPDHSDDEDRFILLGISAQLRMLVVCHCYRRDDEIIRIISARPADRRERKRYVQQR